MTMLRFRSAEPPFSDTAVAGKAARLLALIETTGAWEPPGVVTELDDNVFNEALQALAEAGVATSAPFDWSYRAKEPPAEFAHWVDGVRQAIAESPVPELELPRLERAIGAEPLARLVGAGESSLRRYVSGGRPAPEAVASRAHFVTMIVSDLAGSYNEQGIRRWFDRPRSQLGDRSPAELLSGDWDPESDHAQTVLELAHRLVH